MWVASNHKIAEPFTLLAIKRFGVKAHPAPEPLLKDELPP